MDLRTDSFACRSRPGFALSPNILFRLSFLVVSGCLGTACGETIDVSFGELSGTYNYAENGWNCDGRVTGSRITADCILNDTDESWDYRFESRGQASLRATLGSERLEAEIGFESTSTDWEDGGYCSSSRDAITMRITATKSLSRDVDGIFSAIAGRWSVAVTTDTTFLSDGNYDYDTEAPSFVACKNATLGNLKRSSNHVTNSRADVDVMGSVITGESIWESTTETGYDELGRVTEVYTRHSDPEWDVPDSFEVSGGSFGLTVGRVGISKL
jgi:hypothetical protein